MAEIMFGDEDPAPGLRKLIDAADDPRAVVWHPETRSATVPDEVANAAGYGNAPADGGEVVPLDYEALNKEQLQDILRERGLPVSGNKPELVVRLQESDEAEAQEATQPSEPAQDAPAADAATDAPAVATDTTEGQQEAPDA